MTDDEYEQRRKRAILAAFQTGRPVFADSEGELRYADGDRAPLAVNGGDSHAAGRARQQLKLAAIGYVNARSVPKTDVPRATALAIRAHRATRWAFVTSIVAAVANTIVGLWHPWQLAVAAVCGVSAAVWYRVHRGQRALLRGADAQDPGATR